MPVKSKRGKLFTRFVRNHVVAALYHSTGLDRADAREMVDSITDAQLNHYADAQGIEAVGDGGFLDWLIAHKEQIAALIRFLVSLFSLAAEPIPLSEPTPAPV